MSATAAWLAWLAEEAITTASILREDVENFGCVLPTTAKGAADLLEKCARAVHDDALGARLAEAYSRGWEDNHSGKEHRPLDATSDLRPA